MNMTKKERYKMVRDMLNTVRGMIENQSYRDALSHLQLAASIIPEHECPSTEANDLRSKIFGIEFDVISYLEQQERQEQEMQAKSIVHFGFDKLNTEPTATIQTATDELHKAFDAFNHALFNSALPQVALTIQTKGKRNFHGWFTVDPIWSVEKGGMMHEINISAESLNRPFLAVMETLLHEMIHLYCTVKGIQDTSRGNTFHNKHFKAASEAHGFYYDAPADKRYGWAYSKLKPETVQLISSFGLDVSAFKISRQELPPSEKKTNSYKWECPECGCKVRSTKKEVKLICGECSDFDEMEIIKLKLVASTESEEE